MQNELLIIKQQEVLGKDFKVYGDWENPLFLAKDVAEWIDYSYKDSRKIHRDITKMLSMVDDDEKMKNTLNLGGENYSHGGARRNVETWFLTEDGLYEVLMQSRKPIAKAFKKEVKKILKSIRKTDGYINEQLLEELLDSRETADEFLKQLKEEKKLVRANNKLIKTQSEIIGELEDRLDDVLSEAEYCENVLLCENAIPVSVIAKSYGMSAQKFNQLLHFLKIQYKVGGVWALYAKYANVNIKM